MDAQTDGERTFSVGGRWVDVWECPTPLCAIQPFDWPLVRAASQQLNTTRGSPGECQTVHLHFLAPVHPGTLTALVITSKPILTSLTFTDPSASWAT